MKELEANYLKAKSVSDWSRAIYDSKFRPNSYQ